MTITPLAAVELDGLWQDQVSESVPAGSSAAGQAVALRYDAHGQISAPLTLGARFGGSLDLGGGHVLTPSLQIGWVHEFNPERTLTASFAAAPEASFQVLGIEVSREAAQTIAGATLADANSVAARLLHRAVI